MWLGKSLSGAYAWGGGVFSGLVLFVYTMINVGALFFFLRRRRLGEPFSLLPHVITPTIGALVSLWFLKAAFFDTYLSGGGDFKSAGSIVLTVVAWLAVGAIYMGVKVARSRHAAAPIEATPSGLAQPVVDET